MDGADDDDDDAPLTPEEQLMNRLLKERRKTIVDRKQCASCRKSTIKSEMHLMQNVATGEQRLVCGKLCAWQLPLSSTQQIGVSMMDMTTLPKRHPELRMQPIVRELLDRYTELPRNLRIFYLPSRRPDLTDLFAIGRAPLGGGPALYLRANDEIAAALQLERMGIENEFERQSLETAGAAPAQIQRMQAIPRSVADDFDDQMGEVLDEFERMANPKSRARDDEDEYPDDDDDEEEAAASPKRPLTILSAEQAVEQIERLEADLEQARASTAVILLDLDRYIEQHDPAGLMASTNTPRLNIARETMEFWINWANKTADEELERLNYQAWWHEHSDARRNYEQGFADNAAREQAIIDRLEEQLEAAKTKQELVARRAAEMRPPAREHGMSEEKYRGVLYDFETRRRQKVSDARVAVIELANEIQEHEDKKRHALTFVERAAKERAQAPLQVERDRQSKIAKAKADFAHELESMRALRRAAVEATQERRAQVVEALGRREAELRAMIDQLKQ